MAGLLPASHPRPLYSAVVSVATAAAAAAAAVVYFGSKRPPPPPGDDPYHNAYLPHDGGTQKRDRIVELIMAS